MENGFLYQTMTEVNITKLWYTLKPRVEEEEIPAIRMECPAPKQRGDLPEIHVFTSEAKTYRVGREIIDVLKKDITYVVGDGTFSGDHKTLYWNAGHPSYQQGLQENWGIL